MSTYGITFYGTDKYGPSQYVDYDVTPFIVEPGGFDSIDLSWSSPKGSWDQIRLLRNWTGFPVDEQDGEILLDTTGAVRSAIDTNVRPGAWHYYGLWVRVGTKWYSAGIATTLMLADHGYADKMFEHLPAYHRYTSGILDDIPGEENETLKHFLQVLASGLEYLKTYYDNLLVLNDPMKNHLGSLVRLAQQFGIEYLPVTPSHLFRSRVQNAGALARQKGTIEQIRSVIGMSVGWDVEITPGTNLMLNEDTASFVHPIWPDWDPAINYASNETVTYNGYTYRSKTGGAYGLAQKPTGTATTNTWWTYLNGLQDTTYTSPDGSVAGWGPRSFTSGVTPAALSAVIGLGVQSATDPTVKGKNALYVNNKNAGNVVADMGATSTGMSDVDPLNAITRGVPIPKADHVWNAAVEYSLGDIVQYKNVAYRAKASSLGVAPTGTGADNSTWEAVGVDSRVRMCGSLYVKGADATAQTKTAYPVIDFFDSKGALIATVDTSATLPVNVFDAFDTRGGALAARGTDYGSKTWGQIGTWSVDGSNGFAYPSAGGSFAYIDGLADGQIAATFNTDAKAGSEQSLVFRFSGSTLAASVYLKATRTGLYSVNNGTATLIGTHSSAFSNGDRIAVKFSGSTIEVTKNDTTKVLTATSTINQTAVRHGMLVL